MPAGWTALPAALSHRFPLQLILKGIGAKLRAEDIAELRVELTASPLDTTELVAELDDVLVRAEEWRDKLRRALQKRGTTAKVRRAGRVQAARRICCWARSSGAAAA
jgi:hypothetical protein